MTVGKVDFVGIRTKRLQEIVALFRDALGVPIPGDAFDRPDCETRGERPQPRNGAACAAVPVVLAESRADRLKAATE